MKRLNKILAGILVGILIIGYGVILGSFVEQALVRAGTITKSHTFSAGTVIKSSEMNTNFDTIYNEFNGNIESANIKDGTITTDDIADGTITDTDIYVLTITGAKIANATITGAKLVDDTITDTQLATDYMDTAGTKDFTGFPAIATYTTGTVDATNGDTQIVGHSTEWLTNVSADDSVKVDTDGTWYTVDSVDTDTGITLSIAYAGTTVTTEDYTVIPTPVNQEDFATKRYMDSSTKLGAWVSKSADTVYQAETDGFVVVSGQASATVKAYGYTDENTPPTTQRGAIYLGTAETSPGGSFTMPVKKDDYWKVTDTSALDGLEWMPLGT